MVLDPDVGTEVEGRGGGECDGVGSGPRGVSGDTVDERDEPYGKAVQEIPSEEWGSTTERRCSGGTFRGDELGRVLPGEEVL